MGLDTSYDCYHGGYHTFNMWRDKLARVAGYDFDQDNNPLLPGMSWDDVTEMNLMGKWAKLPADPLIILIAHYDCDGIIQKNHINSLADRLKQLEPNMPGEPSANIGFKSWRAITHTFIKGLEQAAQAGQGIKFG